MLNFKDNSNSLKKQIYLRAKLYQKDKNQFFTGNK